MDKITWKVAAEPTGRYRSFEKRGWPHAYWPDDVPCAFIQCNDNYTGPRARGEQPHAELVIWVSLSFEDGSFVNRRLKARAATLAEAKELVQKFWAANYSRRYFRKPRED